MDGKLTPIEICECMTPTPAFILIKGSIGLLALFGAAVLIWLAVRTLRRMLKRGG